MTDFGVLWLPCVWFCQLRHSTLLAGIEVSVPVSATRFAESMAASSNGLSNSPTTLRGAVRKVVAAKVFINGSRVDRESSSRTARDFSESCYLNPLSCFCAADTGFAFSGEAG